MPEAETSKAVQLIDLLLKFSRTSGIGCVATTTMATVGTASSMPSIIWGTSTGFRAIPPCLRSTRHFRSAAVASLSSMISAAARLPSCAR